MKNVADRVIETEVLVIGTEAAGAIASLEACPSADVTLVTKSLMGKSGVTIMAVATYSAPVDPRDNEEIFFQDIVREAHFLSDQRLARILASEAMDSVRQLKLNLYLFAFRQEL